MTIQDLRNLDREAVLGWLGLEEKSSAGATFGKAMSLFAGGLVTGAVLALLFAPKAGRGLREDIRTRLRRNGRGMGADAALDDQQQGSESPESSPY